MAHAVLSPSGAHRWMACPPSARLEQMFPDTTSEVAEEGTLAHHLAEISLKRYIGNIDQRPHRQCYHTQRNTPTTASICRAS